MSNFLQHLFIAFIYFHVIFITSISFPQIPAKSAEVLAQEHPIQDLEDLDRDSISVLRISKPSKYCLRGRNVHMKETLIANVLSQLDI